MTNFGKYQPPKSMLVNCSEKTTIVITLRPDVFKALDAYAKLTDTSRVNVVRNALKEEYLERENGLPNRL